MSATVHGQDQFLRLNGIPTSERPDGNEIFFSRDIEGSWKSSRHHLAEEIERACVKTHDRIKISLFPNFEEYREQLINLPLHVPLAGLNSESILSRDQFEKFVSAFSKSSTFNRFLYLYDFQKLVSGIQECTKEIYHLQGEFYRILNLDLLFYPPIREEDGIRYISSPTVTSNIAILNFIFVRMHSLLDYVTKLVYEVENIRSDFKSYPKLSCSNTLFGDRKRIKAKAIMGTIFEPNSFISEIEAVRNLVIHDGFLDDMPKIYKVIQNGITVEKFILMPDQKKGRFDKFGNRNLFYSREDKINQRLPDLISEISTRTVKTLRLVLKKFQ